MVFLARNYKDKKICSTKAISQKEGIPFDFLEKIISKLEKNKLVKGKKGVSGGYILSRMPGKIRVKDIIDALEGKNPIVSCLFCGKSGKCSAKNVWQKVDQSLDKTLSSIKLSKIA